MSSVDPERSSLCVYTVKIGNYDSLLEQPVAAQSSAKFICFTDDKTLKSDTWEIRLIEPMLPADLPRSSRYPKICAHRYLPDYELSIYMDANVVLTAPPERVIDELFRPAACDMVCLQNDKSDSLMRELFAVVAGGYDDAARCVEQVNHYYLSLHYPSDPPIWGGLLIRRHNAEAVIQAMELWFTHVLRYSRRDQLSFGYVAASLGFPYRALPLTNTDSGYHQWPRGHLRVRTPGSIKPDVLPLALSTPYALRLHTRAEESKPMPRPIGPPADRPSRIVRGLRRLKRRVLPPRHRGRLNGVSTRRRVVFMLSSLADPTASTTIYARQLRDIADLNATSLGYETSLSDSLGHYDSILILSKLFLKTRTAEHLQKLRERGNILIGCFVDELPPLKKVKCLDGLFAASLEQHRFFLTTLPHIPSFLVNHGVDARIQYPVCQQTKFAAAYFGEPTNGLYLDVLQQIVTCHQTPTKSSALDWVPALADYNCHYLLRPPVPPGMFKPFTKGFVAAACGAVVIADGNDPTAVEMLGENYPFFARDLSITGVRETLAAANDAFGGPDWALARGIVTSLRREYEPQTIGGQLATALRFYL